MASSDKQMVKRCPVLLSGEAAAEMLSIPRHNSEETEAAGESEGTDRCIWRRFKWVSLGGEGRPRQRRAAKAGRFAPAISRAGDAEIKEFSF